MIDWRSLSWWDMPGPQRFLTRVANAVTGSESGVVGLLLPNPRPTGLLDALQQHIDATTPLSVVEVDASGGLRGRAPTTLMALTAGVSVLSISSIADFIDSAALQNKVFLVDGIPSDEWVTWSLTLRRMIAERKHQERLLAPSVLVTLPGDVPTDQTRSAVGNQVIQWMDCISRIDTELYVERLMAWPDGTLASRTAVSVVVELAGWWPELAMALADHPPEDLVNPMDLLLKEISDIGEPVSSWANGQIDYWDGHIVERTDQLVREDRLHDLESRIWRGQVATLLPFANKVRHAYLERYKDILRVYLPYKKPYREEYCDNLYKLELSDLKNILRDHLKGKEKTLLWVAQRLRTNAAHYDAAPAEDILRASELWEELSERFQDKHPGWNWPRCNQKLVVMVGPVCAGKSTWAAENYAPEEIVSSDAIRERMSSNGMTPVPAKVFRHVQSEAVKRLSNGLTVVIDATNLKASDRLANVRLVPRDIQVEYVVLDRPMADKMASSDWREPELIEEYAARMEEEIEAILVGDNLPNVKVVDRRKSVVSADEQPRQHAS